MPGTSIWHTCCSRITPAAAEGLRRRAWRYNTAVQRARSWSDRALCLHHRPGQHRGNVHLTKNRACLEKMYAKGKQDAEALVRWDTKTPNKMNRWAPRR
ncbi:MAG: hypothetical protein ACLVJH_10480 [Faecalibacterium prausnitzii]